MHKHAIVSAVTAILALSACNNDDTAATGNSPVAQTSEAQEAAGDKAIAAGIPAGSQFMAAAKAAGLDQTLAGPGPYTVLVPVDAAFAAAPAGTFDPKPENRARITGVLTNLILPGTVLSTDIDKAIEAGKGKAVLATMGGGTITATKEGGKTVFTDASGKKVTVTEADQRFTNGVVHQIDGVLMPATAPARNAS
ncbi:fasciclin domain-containing protein [Sphingomonas lutea]|uniref:Fasciclin domain-containing protein n=1 Tax=Sphingomonas lutea TaxID=1045317 RepID=A0A7G9SIN3_9SPHN|nr:fasciclin domain-containing protein [Sphingomonas lutea]QNN67708.1 fasciclin domain-containing protein [Sphingomonas lutea]